LFSFSLENQVFLGPQAQKKVVVLAGSTVQEAVVVLWCVVKASK